MANPLLSVCCVTPSIFHLLFTLKKPVSCPLYGIAVNQRLCLRDDELLLKSFVCEAVLRYKS